MTKEEKFLKRTFFLQYWGDFYFTKNTVGYISSQLMENWDEYVNKSYVELFDLNKITDEHAQKLCFNKEKDNYPSAKSFLSMYESVDFLTQQEADTLRSLGYLVPFMNMSIEQILEKGWAKYKH